VLPFGGGGRLSAKIPPEERSSSVQAASEQRAIETPAAPDPARRMLTEQLPVLRAVARNLVRNANEVEDLVQDVYERTLRQIDRLDMMANPRGWMVTVLHNLHIDRCRQRARMKPHVPCDDLPLAAPEEREAPAWSAITAEDVRRATAELPRELREPYVMFALEGRSYIEVAAALGIPKATVGTRISRARVRLKELLTAKLAEEGS
jgi:RNA polymerase sigma-70 factor (ECF subfamily)